MPAAAAAAAPLRPESALDAATAEYLAHAGRFAAAKELVLEAGLFEKKGKDDEEEAGRAAAEALVAPFVEAEAALSSLRYPRCDAEPALAWLASKRRAMAKKKKKKKNGISGGFDALEFSLLRAKFASVLAAEGPRAALRFVNSRMARFAAPGDGEKDAARSKRYLDEIMRLMGAVALFIDAGDGGGGNGEKEGEEEAPPTATSRTRSGTTAAASSAATAAASSPSSRRRHRITATNQQRLPARYRDLFSRSLWDAAAEELAAAACELAGVPARPPLLVAAAAGAAALPTLLKLSNKMSAGGPGRTAAVVGGGGGAGGGGSSAAAAAGADGRASAADFGARDSGGGEGTKNPGGGNGNDNDDDDAALPVDLNLGPEFAFTTIFSCPVSRDTATRDNPPMLLPCGHVFCRAAVSGISRGGPASRAFKCPLCPTEATPGSCRALVFPPFGAVGRGGGGDEEEEEEKEEEEEEGGGGKEAMVSD